MGEEQVDYNQGAYIWPEAVAVEQGGGIMSVTWLQNPESAKLATKSTAFNAPRPWEPSDSSGSC